MTQAHRKRPRPRTQKRTFGKAGGRIPVWGWIVQVASSLTLRQTAAPQAALAETALDQLG
jgi:hypothetical protein